METSRQTKKTLYVVAAFYVVVGFVAATASALNGDRVGTFLGFLIVSGALAATALLRAVLRIGVRLSAIGDAMEDLHARLGRLETGLNELRERPGVEGRAAGIEGGVRMLDLATMGGGDPGVLAAATLDNEAYPRLVKTMEEEPPAQSDEAGAKVRNEEVVDGESTKNFMQQWKAALRDGDLAGCRAAYCGLMDAAGAEAVASMGEQIEELADRVEGSLRGAFSSRVRERDYAGAMAIGERICGLLADRAVAAEVQRLRPYLIARRDGESKRIDRSLAASQ